MTTGTGSDTSSPLQNVLDTAGLRQAGRTPPTPFSVVLVDGSTVSLHRLLRVLPGKRIVGEGRWNDRHVLVKLFVGGSSARHWAQEKRGIETLRKSGVSTPALLLACALPREGHVLLTAFLEGAQSLAEVWKPLAALPAGSAAAFDVLCPAFREIGRLHAAGCVHDDLHLGNFLRCDAKVFVIDGDAVRSVARGKPLGERLAAANLAVLLAQLPLSWDAHRRRLIDAYVAGGGQSFVKPVLLDNEVLRIRSWRLVDFLGKSVRDCTLFAVVRGAFRFSATLRTAVEFLAPIMAAPDAAIDGGVLLKDGRTSTVAQVAVGERTLVIKRYNLKSLPHALSRFWRPSRAWHSWREGHRLAFYGIATPAPLGLVEERLGPLRRRAFLITEHCPGVNLLELLSADQPPPDDVGLALVSLFRTLHDLRISHGDLKASNLLWYEGRVFLIDLDAMQQHRSPFRYARAWKSDRARLLRNWPQASALNRWLDANLPATGA